MQAPSASWQLRLNMRGTMVITDVNPYRLELAKVGVTAALDVRKDSIEECMVNLGMKEGFDVGMEMSGNDSAFRSMLDIYVSWRKIALQASEQYRCH